MTTDKVNNEQLDDLEPEDTDAIKGGAPDAFDVVEKTQNRRIVKGPVQDARETLGG